MPGHEDRIDGQMRMRAVAAAALDMDLDAIGRGHHRPRTHGDLSRRKSRPVVQRVDLVGGKALEQAVVDHRLAAGKAFFAGLEDQVDGAVEVAHAGQIGCGPEQHRRVPVVSAAVHPSP